MWHAHQHLFLILAVSLPVLGLLGLAVVVRAGHDWWVGTAVFILGLVVVELAYLAVVFVVAHRRGWMTEAGREDRRSPGGPDRNGGGLS